MPNFRDVRKALKDSSHPLMVFLSKGEVASQKTSLRAFTNGDISVVSNVDRFYSPVDGSELAKLANAEECAGTEFAELNNLITMRCTECAATAGVDPDLAFELANSPDMCCPVCAKATKFELETDETAGDDTGGDISDEDDEDFDPANLPGDSDEDETDTDTDPDDAIGDDVDDMDPELAGDDEDEEDMGDEDDGDMESEEDEDFDTDSFAISEAVIMDESSTMEAKIAALKEIMAGATGDDAVEVTADDVQAFIDEANEYGDDEDEGDSSEMGEMASFAVVFAKAARETAAPFKAGKFKGKAPKTKAKSGKKHSGGTPESAVRKKISQLAAKGEVETLQGMQDNKGPGWNTANLKYLEQVLDKLEHASDADSEFTADSGHKAVFDKFKGVVTVQNGDTTMNGKLLKVLKEDTLLVEADGKKYTVKVDNVSEGEGAAMVTANSVQETASDGRPVVPTDMDLPVKPVDDTPPAADREVLPAPGAGTATIDNGLGVVPAVTEEVVDPAVIPPVTAETEEVQVDTVSLADPDRDVKLTALSRDGSEIAAFVGDTHVGTLHRRLASERASALYDDGAKLAAAFRSAFGTHRKNIRGAELAAFGFKPTTLTINVEKQFAGVKAAEVASARETAAAETAKQVAKFAGNLELAFIGINKGVFPSDSSLTKEIASLLARNGVANSELEARKLLAKHSHLYVKAGVQKATELAAEDDNYIRGITNTINTAEYLGGATGSETASVVLPPTAFYPALPTAETASDDSFIGSRPTPTPAANPYSGAISRLRRR